MTTRFSSKSAPDFAHFADEKAQGISGGTALVGGNIRQLNTVVKNNISGASLSNNLVTLPAGQYKIQAKSPAYNSKRHVLILQKRLIVAGSEVVETVSIGSSEYNAGGTASTFSRLACDLILTDTTVFHLYHNIETPALIGHDLGVNSAFGVGRFAEFFVWRY